MAPGFAAIALWRLRNVNQPRVLQSFSNTRHTMAFQERSLRRSKAVFRSPPSAAARAVQHLASSLYRLGLAVATLWLVGAACLITAWPEPLSHRLFSFVLLGCAPAFAAGLSGVALNLVLTSASVVCGKFASVNQYVGAQGRWHTQIAGAMHHTCSSTRRLFAVCRHALSRTATILRVSPPWAALFVKAITFPIRLAARTCIAILPREV